MHAVSLMYTSAAQGTQRLEQSVVSGMSVQASDNPANTLVD